jgi:Ca2+-binding EF-hand superfamily protein
MNRTTLLLGVFLMFSACGESGGSAPSSEADILRRLGALGRPGLSQSQLDAYAATFEFLDADGSDVLSLEEYEEKSIFGNSVSASRVFAATDRDGSGGVSLEEYVDNRIITDEAKAIHQAIDLDGSGGIGRAELEARTSWAPGELDLVFEEFDGDGDGQIVQIEWLITWGNWARLPGAGLV